ncbi:MAG TPA: HEAT repeat domain-containing protein [Ignavibacteriaceae bacterium]|nr:HEAT repeat domain-containing protein [Ignavibacteriaceae bacterium]
MDNKNKESRNSELHELIIQLGSEDGMERQRAREALVTVGKESIEFLSELLSHPKHIYRWEAVKTLEEIADPVSIPLLIQALEDDKSDVRWIAAKGLIKLGSKSIEPLLKILEEKSESVFVLEGAHHVFFDLRENEALPKDFPIDKLLSALKNPEWVESVKPLVYEILNKTKEK